MPTPEIEDAAAEYRRSLDHLLDVSSALDRRLREVQAEHAPVLRRAANQAAQDGAVLENLVAEAPEFFEKPRTRTLHGIRVGFQRTNASLSIPNEGQTVARIKELLPGRQSDLVEVKEKPKKRNLWALGRSMLERIGVTVQPEGEKIVVRPAESEAMKMAEQMLQAAELAADQDGDAATHQQKGAAG
jgi:hypothetical protein